MAFKSRDDFLITFYAGLNLESVVLLNDRHVHDAESREKFYSWNEDFFLFS
jgi:hypothetical protein